MRAQTAKRRAKREQPDGAASNKPEASPPLWNFAAIGALSLMTIGLSNTALSYLSYPTQVIFKMQKPVSVMLVGVVVLRKSHTRNEYVAVALLTAGLIVFSLTNKALDESTFNAFGIACIVSALAVDGVVGNVQQGLFQKYEKVSASLMICLTKGFAGLAATALCALNGQIAVAWRTVTATDLKWMFLYAALGAIGEQFVMRTIKRFGALPAVIVTSLRKFITVGLSFVVFPKPFAWSYVVGALLVFAGVGLNVREARAAKRRAAGRPAPHAHRV